MYIFAIAAAAVALGFYEYVVKPNLASAQVGGPSAPTGPAFTAGGKIKVGDIVTVSAVSIEPNEGPGGSIDSATGLDSGVQSETILMTPDTFASGTPIPIPTDADKQALTNVDALSSSGGTVNLVVTATGLASNGTGTAPTGTPISIGVLQVPGLSTRLAAIFLNASVQRIVRNGQVVP